MFQKGHLPIKKRQLMHLKKCVATEIRVEKKVIFSCLYRLPSETKVEFEEFYTNLNIV